MQRNKPTASQMGRYLGLIKVLNDLGGSVVKVSSQCKKRICYYNVQLNS